MKYDLSSVEEVEKREGVILLSKVDKLNQYAYKRIIETGIGILQFEVKSKKGKICYAKFIKADGLDFAKRPKRRGRPFRECEGCPHIDDCSSYTCARKEVRLKEVEKAKAHEGDDRFFKNGNPKVMMMLCKYAKYQYAHGIAGRECQKEKCRFYCDGKCYLNLDNQQE